MKCSVRFKLNEVACPGTLHLPDRNPVYLVVCIFGRLQRTQHAYPSFPMVFNAKIKFQRIFTNAKSPDHVLEILEDETILIELRQHTKGYKGGRVIASYEEGARKFLFPSQSYIPKQDHLKRDILLTRTEHFPNGKALDPQLIFRTKTSIEEAPSVLFNTPTHLSISKQIPASSHSKNLKHLSTSSIKKKSHKKNKSLRKSTSTISYYNHSSSDDSDIKDVDDIINKRANKSISSFKHCICECPVLSDEQFDLGEWIETISSNQEKVKTPVKPFRTGKAPDYLMAKRTFSTPFKDGNQTYNKALCKYCLIPAKSCVLCNAYKTVYGPDSFLRHRFERFRKDTLGIGIQDSSIDLRLSSYSYASKPKHHRTKSNPDAVFQKSSNKHSDFKQEHSTPHTPSKSIMKHSTPMARAYKHRSASSSDHDVASDSETDINHYDSYRTTNNIHSYRSQLTPRSYVTPSKSPSSTDDEIVRSSFVQSPRNRSKLFRGSGKKIDRNVSFLEESEKIHLRIKDLMKKNNSVLQHDLSSSDSITDDDTYEYNVPHQSPTRASNISSRRGLPSQSVVLPLGGGKLWSSNKERNYEHCSPRDVFDSSLKSIYQDMYEKTLKQK